MKDEYDFSGGVRGKYAGKISRGKVELTTEPSERLKKVLAVGDALALFPLLEDWPTEELEALLEDVDWYFEAAVAAIDSAWKKAAFEPALFFNKQNQKALDRARELKRLEALATTAEICSVALLYLEERRVATGT